MGKKKKSKRERNNNKKKIMEIKIKKEKVDVKKKKNTHLFLWGVRARYFYPSLFISFPSPKMYMLNKEASKKGTFLFYSTLNINVIG
jgi:hypothetical protein